MRPANSTPQGPKFLKWSAAPAGLIVPVEDAGATAEAIMRLARDETLRWRFGLAAREHLVTNRIIAFFTSCEALRDYGCTLKVYREPRFARVNSLRRGPGTS